MNNIYDISRTILKSRALLLHTTRSTSVLLLLESSPEFFFRKTFTAKFVALFVADGVEFSTRFLQISSVVLPNRTFSAIFLSLNTLNNWHYIETLCFRTFFFLVGNYQLSSRDLLRDNYIVEMYYVTVFQPMKRQKKFWCGF